MPHSQADTFFFRSGKGLVQRMGDAIAKAASRRHERRQLAGLDAHLLRDIGLSPEDADDEASKPFWRP